jgi:hypothetical protein
LGLRVAQVQRSGANVLRVQARRYRTGNGGHQAPNTALRLRVIEVGEPWQRWCCVLGLGSICIRYTSFEAPL